MRMAVIGAGFAGLAVVWHALPHFDVTLFEAKPIADSASGLASGLLHQHPGKWAKKSWESDAAFKEACQLIQAVSDPKDPLFKRSGVLRVAVTEFQRTEFAALAATDPALSWWDAERCEAAVPGLAAGIPGLWVEDAYQIDCPAYLKALWSYSEARGAEWVSESVESLDRCANFDAIIVTAGFDTLKFPELSQLPLRSVKGQILELHWPEDLAPLPFPLNSQGHLVMLPGNRSCLAGATYERGWSCRKPDPERATTEILASISPFFPAIESMELIRCRSGLRAFTPQHLPLLKQIDARTWVLAGLGSKGLLYHSYLAKDLVARILRA